MGNPVSTPRGNNVDHPLTLAPFVRCRRAGEGVSSEEFEALQQQNCAMREALDSARQELLDVYKQVGRGGGCGGACRGGGGGGLCSLKTICVKVDTGKEGGG